MAGEAQKRDGNKYEPHNYRAKLSHVSGSHDEIPLKPPKSETKRHKGCRVSGCRVSGCRGRAAERRGGGDVENIPTTPKR